MPCWNVTLLFIVMHILDNLRTSLTGYGSDFQYCLAVDGVKVFFHKLGLCESHRLAGTVYCNFFCMREHCVQFFDRQC